MTTPKKSKLGCTVVDMLDHMAVRMGHDLAPGCCEVHRQAVASAKRAPSMTLDPNNIHHPDCWRFGSSVLRIADQLLDALDRKPGEPEPREPRT